MSSLLDTRDAIVTALQADSRLAGVNVYDHGDTFGPEDLARYSKKAPALIVALLAFDFTDEGGATAADATWGVIALARDEPALRRDRGVIVLIDRAARVLVRLFAGLSGTNVSKPRGARAENQYGQIIDKQGIAMWSITFKQAIDLQEESDPSVPWLHMHAKIDLAPADGTAESEDRIELTEHAHPDFTPVFAIANPVGAYLALHTAAGELSGYDRIWVVFDTDTDTNPEIIYFRPAVSTVGPITAIALYDVVSGGSPLAAYEIPGGDQPTLAAGDHVEIHPGAVSFAP